MLKISTLLIDEMNISRKEFNHFIHMRIKENKKKICHVTKDDNKKRSEHRVQMQHNGRQTSACPITVKFIFYTKNIFTWKFKTSKNQHLRTNFSPNIRLVSKTSWIYSYKYRIMYWRCAMLGIHVYMIYIQVHVLTSYNTVILNTIRLKHCEQN